MSQSTFTAPHPFTDKVVLITGAARGQGRNHAVRFAEAGASIIAIDACTQIDSLGYDLATEEDLAETVRLVEAAGGRIEAIRADVRDALAMTEAIETGVARFGGLDIVIANAGIAGSSAIDQMPEAMWQDMIDINLSGIFHTVKPAVAHLRGRTGASIVLISSIAGLKGLANNAHYAAAKHGVVGAARALTNELAPQGIRVNVVNPTNVGTRMLLNDALYHLFRPDQAEPTQEQAEEVMVGMHPLGIPYVTPDDVTHAVMFLASDHARYVTGVTLPVDAGHLA